MELHNLIPLCPHTVSWSPDGESLAFVFPCIAVYPSGLWSVAAEGGEAELLVGPVANVNGVDWSPDGDEIAFTHESIETFIPELATVRLGDTEAETRAQAGGFPFWSPDGSRLAFVAVSDIKAEIVLLERDGQQTTIVDLEGQNSRMSIAWSPDGEYLAYASAGSPGLFIVDVSGNGLPFLIHPGPVVALDW